MPIHNYICLLCKKEYERQLKLADIDNQYCECGEKLERQFPTKQGGFRLKGDGFHKSDYHKFGRNPDK